ncbi:MAG: IclR family transcriptional regulator [Microbacteriaceae bacterium]|nr:IclR family transcriptional regulator [Microbacteriaceae bacterium]
MTSQAEESQSAQFVQSLARGLAVIRSFDAENPEMTLSDVARLTGLTRATARRFLLTLVDLGYVRTDGKVFVLSARVLELGYSYLSGLSLPEIVQPHLEELMAEVQESTSAAVLDDVDIAYVNRVPTRRIMSVSINVGTRFPAWATSMGRVLLAALPADERADRVRGSALQKLTDRSLSSVEDLETELGRVAEQGWAIVDQELEIGLRSIAVPIADGTGRVIAAINVSGQANDPSVDEFRQRFLPALQLTAGRITAELRSSKPISRLMTSG